MTTTVYLNTCPRCGGRAQALTIKRTNGDTYRAIRCAEQQCGVTTEFSKCELPKVVYRWNFGIGLLRQGRYWADFKANRRLTKIKIES